MSVLERRLQLLLDAARHDRLVAESKRSGRSVASLIREAIDQRFPTDDDERASGAADFLARTANPLPGEAESWADQKAAYDQWVDEKLARL